MERNRKSRDDMDAEITDMNNAMAAIYDLAYNADEDNWKDNVDKIQTIAEKYY